MPPAPAPDQRERDRRAIFAICGRFRLGRGERCEIASVLLDRNVETYSDLSTPDLARLRDGFEVAALVCAIQMERRRGERR